MASSQLALALSAPWGDLKISGRKIKEMFYTLVDAPADADSELPHFRCRCGKIRIQSLKHGYTNLKQHVMFKHPTWVLEHAQEIQATPPNSPKPERAGATASATARAKAKASKAAAASPTALPLTVKADGATTTTAAAPPPATTTTATTVTSASRKKRKISNAAATTSEAAVDADVAEPPAKTPASRRSRTSSAASTSSSSSSATAPTATPKVASDTPASAVKKREDYISWDDYFMSVAFLSAMRSKDPSTQVGACIVNSEKKIVGIGYNGFPNGCSDDTLPWARETMSGDPLDTKYPFVCHAEMNAILNKNASDLKGCTIYIALFPCNECAKLIIQSGITHIVFLSDKYHDDWKMVASRRMLDMAGVEYRQHHVSKPTVVIDFSAIA